jgi:hypothetical protein
MTNTDGVVYYDGSKLNTTTVGTAGQVLTSNGAGVAPTFQAGGGGSNPAANCSFVAHASAGSQTVTAGNITTVTFGTVVTNNGSVFAGNTFTVPTSGKLYYLSFGITAQTASTVDSAYINVNGTQIIYTHNVSTIATGYFTFSGSIVVPLTSGDTVTISYQNGSGTTSATLLGDAAIYYTYFVGYQLT